MSRQQPQSHLWKGKPFEEFSPFYRGKQPVRRNTIPSVQFLLKERKIIVKRHLATIFGVDCAILAFCQGAHTEIQIYLCYTIVGHEKQTYFQRYYVCERQSRSSYNLSCSCSSSVLFWCVVSLFLSITLI